MRSRRHYHVYVIELSKDVLYEGRFKRCNPGYVSGKPCVYVGMTGIDPDVRFDKHKAGIQSNRYVREFGLRLLPDLYEAFNRCPTTKHASGKWRWELICAKPGLESGRLEPRCLGKLLPNTR